MYDDFQLKHWMMAQNVDIHSYKEAVLAENTHLLQTRMLGGVGAEG
jgi:hypothetical protein